MFTFIRGSRHPTLRAVSRSLVGVEGALPDTYGMQVDELVDLMEAYRVNAIGR